MLIPTDSESIQDVIEHQNQIDPLARVDLSAALRDALKRVPAFDLILFYEFFVCGVSYTELGQMAGMSRQSVSRHIERARERLHNELSE